MKRNSLTILREKAIHFIHSMWGKDCYKNPMEDIDTSNFNQIANRVFIDMIRNVKSSVNPFMFRIAGQSGSGKTTQLLPSIQKITDKNFVNISVRIFAKYHPRYNELLLNYGESMIREKTNGFALLMLFRIMELLIKNRYNIIFETTLLDNTFEEYLFKLSKKNNYTIHIHTLSISQKISNLWIEYRKNNSLTEKNRVVLKSSSDFFFNILPITIKNIIEYNFWNKTDKIILWNGFSNNPIYIGKIKNNKDVFNIFQEYREIDNFKIQDKQKLLNAKIRWFKKYYATKYE